MINCLWLDQLMFNGIIFNKGKVQSIKNNKSILIGIKSNLVIKKKILHVYQL